MYEETPEQNRNKCILLTIYYNNISWITER